MILKLKNLLLAHKLKAIIIFSILAVLAAGWFAFSKISATPSGPLEEIELSFDAEGPYPILYPRRDGNALVLNLKRTASYDSISYELAYTSTPDETAVKGTKILDEGEGAKVGGSIDRGVMGTIDTKEKRGEYEQEILFGSCSKNVCKYDKGVENGTLALRVQKGNKVYKMITQWHLQQPDVALGKLTSGDEHLVYNAEGDREKLANTAFTIINDLTGVPKLPGGKTVAGKVYALNVPVAKELPSGQMTVELAENPSQDAKIYRYSINSSEWQELETQIEGSKLSAKAPGAGIFAVLTPK